MADRTIVSFRLHALGNDESYQDVGVVLTLEEEKECDLKQEGEERQKALAVLAGAKLLNHIKDCALIFLDIKRISLPDVLVK